MTQAKVRALLMVLAGSFASQPSAFTCLCDEAEQRGISVDLGDIDVIQAAANVRLAHYFRPAIVARIQELQGDDDTVILVRPSLLAREPQFPSPTSRLRLLGRFAGEIVEVAKWRDWV
ncbi:MAG: hypothetical protein ACR2OY_10220 [Boseongicola sp.]